MKRSMRWTVVVGALISVSAFAGAKWSNSLSIYLGNGSGGWAGGDLATIRGDSSSSDSIECTVYMNTSMSGPAVVCQAYQTNISAYASCTSTNPAVVQVAESISSDGYLTFEWDGSGNCNYINVQHGSPYAPKSL